MSRHTNLSTCWDSWLCWSSPPHTLTEKGTNKTCLTMTKPLVLARLDYCNGVLAGLPATQLSQLQSVLHAAARLIYWSTGTDSQCNWLSVPERVTFKLCVMDSWCIAVCMVSVLNTSRRTSGSCPRFILASDWVRPPVPTSWLLPHAGLHLATEHSRSQELERGTRYQPVSPLHHLCPHSSSPEDISFPASTVSITLITVSWSWSKCLALSTSLILANWTELNWTDMLTSFYCNSTCVIAVCREPVPKNVTENKPSSRPLHSPPFPPRLPFPSLLSNFNYFPENQLTKFRAV